MKWYICMINNLTREINQLGQVRIRQKYKEDSKSSSLIRCDYKDSHILYKPSKIKLKINIITDLPNEEWKIIFKRNQYEYFVSNMGRQKIKRYYYATPVYTEKLCKNQIDKDGYILVCHPNGSRIYGGLHRLVARHFLSTFDESLTVNHKNLIKSDNKIDNLEMLTLLDNIQHAWKTMKETGVWRHHEDLERDQWAKNKEERALFKDIIKNEYESGIKQIDLAKKYNCTQQYISMIINDYYKIRK